MNIFVNNNEYHFSSPLLTLAQLAEELNFNTSAANVTVNGKTVSKILWLTTYLTDGDGVTVTPTEGEV